MHYLISVIVEKMSFNFSIKEKEEMRLLNNWNIVDLLDAAHSM